ncbi:SGNH/GDSL hydrolase family protein [Phenylobacterium sp.]|uniref:SGNH/GDSL hydrolase family protein n=1 Tax=Phenylobacterium sp. TaxID=1871053 RepID=UPI00300333D2
MGSIKDAGDAWLRDYVTDGVPTSGFNEPLKSEGRAVFDLIDTEFLSLQSGLIRRDPVRALAASNVNLTTDVDAGSTLDGVTLAENDRIALIGQTAPAENGVYVVPAAAGTATRATDMNEGTEFPGATFLVREGSTYAGTTWSCTNASAPTVGTDAVTFVQTGQEADYSALEARVTVNEGDIADLETRIDDAELVTDLVKPSPVDDNPIILGITDEAGFAFRTIRADGTERGPLYDVTPEAVGRLVVTDPKGFVMADLEVESEAEVDPVAVLPARVYLDGDSRSDLCTNPGRSRSQGWLFWAQTKLGGRFDISNDWNNGVGGQDSQEMLDRVENLRAFEPGLVICICSTNDRTGTGQTADWTIARLAEYQAAVLGMGHRLLWIAETPRGDSVNTSYDMTSTQVAYQQRVRQWQLDQGAVQGVYVADPYSLMVDPASTDGRALDTILRDGIHWGAFGAWYVAEPVIEALQELFPPRPVLPTTNADVYSSNNPTGALNPNPMLLGTSGTAGTGCTGNVATGWEAVAGAGLSATLSKVTSGGHEWQQIVVTGAPTDTADTDTDANLDPRPVSVVLSADLSNVNEGDILDAVAAIEVDAGATGLRGVSLYIEAVTASTNVLYAAGEPDVIRSQINLDVPDEAWDGVLRVPVTEALEGTITGATLNLVISGANFVSTAETISATIRVRAAKARKIL